MNQLVCIVQENRALVSHLRTNFIWWRALHCDGVPRPFLALMHHFCTLFWLFNYFICHNSFFKKLCRPAFKLSLDALDYFSCKFHLNLLFETVHAIKTDEG
jgi:hypothetical protein